MGFIFLKHTQMVLYRRRRPYAKRTSYFKKKSSALRSKPKYVARRRRTYRKRVGGGHRTYLNPYKTTRRNDKNYVKYIYQSTDGDFVVPASTTNTSSGSVQGSRYWVTDFTSITTADPLAKLYAQIYLKYRIKHMWVEFTPKFSNVTQNASTRLGEMWLVPVHTSEEILRTGQAWWPIGTTMPTTFNPVLDYWKNLKHAKRFTFNKPGQKCRIRVNFSTFKYEMANPSIDSAGGAGFLENIGYAKWFPTTTWSGTVVGSLSNIQHFGLVAIFAGWQTSSTDTFAFEVRHWYQLEFKDYQAVPVLDGKEQLPAPMVFPNHPEAPPFELDEYDEKEMADEMSEAETVVVNPPYPQRLVRPPLPLSKVSSPAQKNVASAASRAPRLGSTVPLG